MTAPALARLTSLIVVGTSGMVVGHVLNPLGPGRGAGARLAVFALALAAVGAWRGWREVAVRAQWIEMRPAPGAAARGAAVGAVAALLTGALAYLAVHGP